jgi:transposase InsO family protein
VDAGRPIAHVAAEAGIGRNTLGKWYARWLEAGEEGLHDRSSRPHRSPNQTPEEIEDRVEALRRRHKLGPVQIMGRLAEEGITLGTATIHRILVRRGISRLRDLDVSGENMRKVPIIRYEWARPGDMIHVDVKKLGRIPDGGGHRVHGRTSAQHRRAERAKAKGAKAGYVYLHSAVDDHTRLAYTEELSDEKGVTAAGFWHRAVKFFRAHGIKRIRRVLTDNGSCYRSKVFALALGRTVHKRTRPYHPQTNGKVERFNRTLAQEWAYTQAWISNDERKEALGAFLDRYNYHRPHTALGGKPPISRLGRAHNVAA